MILTKTRAVRGVSIGDHRHNSRNERYLGRCLMMIMMHDTPQQELRMCGCCNVVVLYMPHHGPRQRYSSLVHSGGISSVELKAIAPWSSLRRISELHCRSLEDDRQHLPETNHQTSVPGINQQTVGEGGGRERSRALVDWSDASTRRRDRLRHQAAAK